MFFLLLLLFSSCAAHYETQLLDQLKEYAYAPESMIADLKKNADDIPNHIFQQLPLPPLFVAHPYLIKTISYVHLGNLPTPLYHAHNLTKLTKTKAIYIKCDNHTGGLKNGTHLFGETKYAN